MANQSSVALITSFIVIAIVAAVASPYEVQNTDVPLIRGIRSIEVGNETLTCIAFASTRGTVAFGSLEGHVWLWQVKDKKPKKVWPVKARENDSNRLANSVLCIAFSHDGSRLLFGAENRVILWDLEAGKVVHTLEGHRGPVWSVAFFRDGQRGLSGSTSDYTVREWDLKTGKEVRKLQAEDRIVSLSLSPDERHLVTNNRFCAAVIWNLETGKKSRILKGHDRKVEGAMYASQGKQIVTASCERDGIHVWDVEVGKLLRRFGGPDLWVEDFAVSPDGKLLLAGGTNEIIFWDFPSGKEIKRVSKLDGRAKVAFSADGRFAASAESLGRVRVWEISPLKKKEK